MLRDIIIITIGFNRGHSKLCRAIQFAENSWFNHVWVGVKFPSVKVIVESMEHGIQLTPWEHLLRAVDAGKVDEFYEVELDLTSEQKHAIYDKSLEIFGEGYDYWQLLRYLLWLKVSSKLKGYMLRRNRQNKFTCNEAVIYMLKDIVPIFKGTDYSYTPERIFRLLHNGKGSRELFGNKENGNARDSEARLHRTE